MLYGVDVHGRYQAGISFATLKAQGYTFAAVKATQGTYLLAPQFVEWIAQIWAVGMVPGAYHWIDNKSTGAEQARYFFNRVRTAGGPGGMLIQLDNEDTAYPATLAHTRDWAAEWAQLSGGHPFLMYTGGWWWRPRGWDGHAITPYLWDSHYLTADADTAPDDPAAFAARIPASWWNPGYGNWPEATFLQFTSRGDAGGLGNNVDLNATRLTRADLEKLLHTQGDADLDQTEHDRLVFMDEMTRDALLFGHEQLGDNKFYAASTPVWVVNQINALTAAVARIEATLAGNAPAGAVDLTDESVARIADAVLDEQHDRLAE